MQAYMLELYQDTLIDLLLPKHAKHLKLDIKKDLKVIFFKSYCHLNQMTICLSHFFSYNYRTYDNLFKILWDGMWDYYCDFGSKLNLIMTSIPNLIFISLVNFDPFLMV